MRTLLNQPLVEETTGALYATPMTIVRFATTMHSALVGLMARTCNEDDGQEWRKIEEWVEALLEQARIEVKR